MVPWASLERLSAASLLYVAASRQLPHPGRWRRGNGSSRGELYELPHRFLVEGATWTPRSSLSVATWRVLNGEATSQRPPMSITSGGQWAPLNLTALVPLPHATEA